MHYVALALIAFAAAVGAVPPVAVVAAPEVEIVARPQYKTAYSVSDTVTGDHKSAHEERDGDVTHGSYSVLQPDGVLRTVKYVSHPITGFQAQVINTGTAVHPGKAVVAAPVAVAAPVPVAVAAPVVQHVAVPVPVVHHVAAPAVAVSPIVHHAPVLRYGLGAYLRGGIHVVG